MCSQRSTDSSLTIRNYGASIAISKKLGSSLKHYKELSVDGSSGSITPLLRSVPLGSKLEVLSLKGTYRCNVDEISKTLWHSCQLLLKIEFEFLDTMEFALGALLSSIFQHCTQLKSFRLTNHAQLLRLRDTSATVTQYPMQLEEFCIVDSMKSVCYFEEREVINLCCNCKQLKTLIAVFYQSSKDFFSAASFRQLIADFPHLNYIAVGEFMLHRSYDGRALPHKHDNVAHIINPNHLPRDQNLTVMCLSECNEVDILDVTRVVPGLAALTLRKCTITEEGLNKVFKNCPNLVNFALLHCSRYLTSSVYKAYANIDEYAATKRNNTWLQHTLLHGDKLTFTWTNRRYLSNSSSYSTSTMHLAGRDEASPLLRYFTVAVQIKEVKDAQPDFVEDLWSTLDITDGVVGFEASGRLAPEIFTSVMHRFPALQHIALSDCNVLTIVPAIAIHCKHITSLRLYNCELTEDASFALIFKNNQRIEELSLVKVTMSNEACSHIAYRLNKLKRLELRNVMVSASGIEAILIGCKQLETFDVEALSALGQPEAKSLIRSYGVNL